MEYKGYLAQVAFDDEAGLFHGEVINTRDVITFQGRSVDELRQALTDSIEEYLAFCAERGEEPNPPFSGRLLVPLSPDQQRKVIMAAVKSGEDVEHWAAEALERAARSA